MSASRIPRLRVGLGVNRRCCQFSLKRCSPSKGGLNPTWAGPCPSRNPCSNFPHGKVCSQRRPVTDGDEGARQGQNGRCRVSAQAVVPSSLTCRSTGRSSQPAKTLPKEASRLFLSTRRVVGGVACSQWLTALTGESPTPFRRTLRTTQAHKSTTKRPCRRGGELVHSKCEFSGMAASPE
jgi:hypothetical protein